MVSLRKNIFCSRKITIPHIRHLNISIQYNAKGTKRRIPVKGVDNEYNSYTSSLLYYNEILLLLI